MIIRLALAIQLLFLLTACGGAPGATATTAAVPTARGQTAASTALTQTPVAAATAMGYLEGIVSIGPLTPVERPGVPAPTPSAEVCTARGLTITDQRGTEVTSFRFNPDCTYRVALAPGSYLVNLQQRQGIGGSKDLPKSVSIEAARTTRLDLSIDTGIR